MSMREEPERPDIPPGTPKCGWCEESSEYRIRCEKHEHWMCHAHIELAKGDCRVGRTDKKSTMFIRISSDMLDEEIPGHTKYARGFYPQKADKNARPPRPDEP